MTNPTEGAAEHDGADVRAELVTLERVAQQLDVRGIAWTAGNQELLVLADDVQTHITVEQGGIFFRSLYWQKFTLPQVPILQDTINQYHKNNAAPILAARLNADHAQVTMNSVQLDFGGLTDGQIEAALFGHFEAIVTAAHALHQAFPVQKPEVN